MHFKQRLLTTCCVAVAAAGCVNTASSIEPLQPLATVSLQPPSQELMTSTTLENQKLFVEDVQLNYNGPIPYKDSVLVDYGYLWCAAMKNGVKLSDATSNPDDTTRPKEEVELQQEIAVSAVIHLCPQNN